MLSSGLPPRLSSQPHATLSRLVTARHRRDTVDTAERRCLSESRSRRSAGSDPQDPPECSGVRGVTPRSSVCSVRITTSRFATTPSPTRATTPTRDQQIFIGGESGEAPASPTGLLVRENTLTNSPANGIAVRDTSSNIDVISNNSSSATGAGISVTSTASGAASEVRSNIMDNNDTYGIEFRAGTSSTFISANHATGNGTFDCIDQTTGRQRAGVKNISDNIGNTSSPAGSLSPVQRIASSAHQGAPRTCPAPLSSSNASTTPPLRVSQDCSVSPSLPRRRRSSSRHKAVSASMAASSSVSDFLLAARFARKAWCSAVSRKSESVFGTSPLALPNSSVRSNSGLLILSPMEDPCPHSSETCDRSSAVGVWRCSLRSRFLGNGAPPDQIR